MAPGRSSGFRAATPTLFNPTCLTALLQDAPYCVGVPVCSSLWSMTWSCQHRLRLGGLLFQLERVGAKEVMDPQPQGSKGKQEESRGRPAGASGLGKESKLGIS